MTLKIGQPLMLIRNINNMRGLVNGTRMLLTGIHDSSRPAWIECQILSGKNIGQEVVLPRLLFKHEEDELCPATFTRKQFPIKICFAMTIAKSQGQTFAGRVGVFLPKPVFAAGALYVAMSRCTDFNNLYFCQPRSPSDQKTVFNVVSVDIIARLKEFALLDQQQQQEQQQEQQSSNTIL